MKRFIPAFLLIAVFVAIPLLRTRADAISSNTVDNNLIRTAAGGPALLQSTLVQVGFGSGNWVTVNLDPTRKYYVYNFGFDNNGTANTYRVKCVMNSSAEPDAGSTVTFAAATNTEIIQPGVSIYPIKGTSSISLKAETGTAMVIVRTIETTPQEQ